MKSVSGPRSLRGSALAVSLLFTGVCAILAISILRWSVSERRMNARAAGWLSARNAAEGLAEYGFSQIRNDFETQANPGIYKPGTANALNLPAASVFAGSSVVTGALSSTNPNGIELIGGPAVPMPNNAGAFTGLFYVDPANLNNQFDPLKGKWVFRQDIVVLARVTVITSVGQPITHYVTETVSVRGAPLFSHAIFYASDLEIDPGPQMDIYGPVHSNGNIFVSNQSDAGGLNFHGTVTTAGNIFHAWSSNSTAAHGSGNETLGENPVSFANLSGNQTNMKATSNASSWKDSTMGADMGISGTTALRNLVTPAVSLSFRQFAASTWGGNLLTGASGIQVYNPIALNQPIDAAGDLPDAYELINAPTPPATTDPYYAAKSEVESQKKSMQAGLYIKVVATSAGTATISMYGPPGSAPAGTPSSQVGPNGGLLLNPPTNVANAPSAATPPLVAYLPYRKKTVVTSGNGSNHTVATTIYDAANNVVSTATLTGQSGTNGTVTSINSDSWSGSYGYGMYDQRRGGATGSSSGTSADGAIDLVQIDMRAVTALVNSMSTGTNNANALTYTDPNDHTTKVWNNANAVASGLVSATQTMDAEKTPWNGAVYVDVQAPNGGTSHQTTSVRLVNGTVASDGTYAGSNSLIPTYGPHGNGLTLATNAPLYILGNFNANGTPTSASPSTPDDGQDGSLGHTSKESPVALAADCITILSPGWSDANSLTLKPSASGDVEVAAAFLVGLTPTATAFSGGAHNLPRFLENWSGKNVAIRGSMVAMFNCRIATQPWSTAYYGAPNRQWGFDSLFKNGVYPPFAPKVLSYRRVDFTDLTAAQYAAKKAALWP